MKKTALIIAGSDSGGGAGIQADIKTMTVNGVFATSAITALTAQNTTGISAIMETSPEFLRSVLCVTFAFLAVILPPSSQRTTQRTQKIA